MNTIKKYQDWLSEKNEAEVSTSMGKVDSKSTEKDFSKSLSSNYTKKDGTTSVPTKTEFTTSTKSSPAKPAASTAPKEEKSKESKPSIDKSNPVKPEKKSLGKVGDVQVSNDTVKNSEPSNKKPHVAEMEETSKKKKAPKLDHVGKEDKDVNNDGKVNKQDNFIKNKREKIGTAISKTKKEESK